MARRLFARCTIALVAIAIAGCGAMPPKREPVTAPPPPRASGGYYKDDGPGANPPANLDSVPDAVPRLEPLHRFANRPYTVFGRDYVPATTLRPYSEHGIASWYGRKFHGERTSIGDVYDMYAMSAAHPTLPLPSYARVTNVANGRSVVVRVNDRGPFWPGRVIDLSYAAAHRLGIAQNGSGEVRVEAIVPTESPIIAAAAPLPPVAIAPVEPTPPIVSMPVATPQHASAPPASGFAVQLGAFASYANAQSFVSHIAPQLASVRADPKVRQLAGLYRVFVGPYATRDEARRTSDSIRDALGLASTIAVH
jgi:rare lipoprotein A